MEPVGLGVGLVGLAGVLNSCLEALDKVRTYRSYAADSAVLDAQFGAGQLMYERWDHNVGDKGLLPVDHETSSVVEELRSQIIKILEANDIPQSGKSKSGHSNKATLNMANPAGITDGAIGSRRRKVAWALWGKGDRTSQVTNLVDLVQRLHDMVPLERAESQRPGSETRKFDDLRGTDPQRNVPGPDMGSEYRWLDEIHEILVEIRQAMTEAQADARREMHSWILGQHSPNERYEDSRRRRLSGTCEWIFTRPEFTRWSSPDFPPGVPEILWIHGRPGFGKTILCSRIVEYLTTIPDVPIAYFFFSSDHESRNDPYVFMRSCVSQLVSHPASQQEVSALVHQKWTTTHDQVATRASIIQLLHGALRARPGCYLIVDGLDECTTSADSSSSVAMFLEDIKKVATPATRILVVSREEPEIRQALQASHQGHLAEYKISSEDVRGDVSALSRSIVDGKLPNKDEGVRASLSETMANRCDGQLLWLKMQEQSLETDMNARYLQRILQSTPAGLGHVYQRNWDRIERSPRSHRAVALLRWAGFARRPLTVGEITEAVLIIEDDNDLLADELPDAIDGDYVEKGILKLCAPLLEVRESQPESTPKSRTVHLAHFTIREFLIGRLPTGGSWWQNETLRASNEQIQNTILARSCLWYVQSRHTWKNGATLHGSPFQSELRDYAAESWHAHVKSGVPLERDLGTLERILVFMNEGHSCWDAWRNWLDMHDEDEKQEAEDEDSPPEPCYYALKLGLKPVVISQIRKSGPGRIHNSTGRSVLHLSCAQGSIELVGMILDTGVDIETVAGTGRTPLYSASHHGRLELVQALVERGAQVNVMNHYGWTPVNRAADNGHLEVVKFLVDRGADITMASNGWTPLISAAHSGHLEVVKVLVEKGADITMTGSDWTPVLAAAVKGHLEIVRFLVEKGADITVASSKGWTPVLAAAVNAHLEVVRFLVEKGADITVANNNGWTPVLAAAVNGHLEVVKLLVDNGADITVATSNGWTLVNCAAERGYLEVIKFLVDRGADITIASSNGWTPVNTAAERGYLGVIKFLVDRGADITVASSNGWTPVHTAASHGHLEIVKFLVEKGAEITVANSNGWTPVNSAASRGYLEVVRFLVDKGADITVATSNGWTPVNCAAERGDLEVIKFLVDQGADIMIASSNGWTPVNTAADEGHLEVVKFLVDRGADITVGNRTRSTPVNCAAGNGHLEIVKFLVDKGADITVANSSGWTPLVTSSRRGHTAVVRHLLQVCRANPNSTSSSDRTPLSWASQKNYESIVQLLLETEGIDINSRDSLGRTPLMWATRAADVASLRLLCQGGADIEAEDNCGLTAMKLAILYGNLTAEHVLMEYGATVPRDVFGFEMLFKDLEN